MKFSFQQTKEEKRPCLQTGKFIPSGLKHSLTRWLFSFCLTAFIWFLVQAVPNPSRATYPCLQAAFPSASGFIVWLLGLTGSAAAFNKAKHCLARARCAAAIRIVAGVCFIWVATAADINHLAVVQADPPGPGTQTGKADIYKDGIADFKDFAVLAAAWGDTAGNPNWNPNYDISSIPGDEVINEKDLAVLCDNWLAITFTAGLVKPGAPLQQVYSASNTAFKGLTWDPNSNKLFFVEKPDAGTYQILRLDSPGSATVWMNNAPGTNGMVLSLDDRLLTADESTMQIRSHRIGASGPEATVVLCTAPDKPNDLCELTNGDIYFTCPDWSSDTYQGVYLLDPNGVVTRVNNDLNQPGGVIASLDENELYVVESSTNDVSKKRWWVFPINPDGTLGAGSVFFISPNPPRTNDPEGMTLDEFGNLYLTGLGGVWIVSSTGQQLDMIQVKEDCSNITFGGPKNMSLYLTCRDKVYSMDMLVSGAKTFAAKTVPLPNMSDGEIRLNEGGPGVHITLMAVGGGYVWGLGSNSKLYKSATGLDATWTLVYANDDSKLNCDHGTLFAYKQADGSLGLLHTNGHNHKFVYSTDAGVTWTNAATPSSWSDNAMIIEWGFCQTPDGNMYVVEYASMPVNVRLKGRYIWRSTDYGVNWSTVLDADMLSPIDACDVNHWHSIAYHAGTGKLVAAAGDSTSDKIVTSTNGTDWTLLYPNGDTRLQPIPIVDIGHPTRLYCGNDGRGGGVYWLDVNTGEIGLMCQDMDSRSFSTSPNSVWSMAYYNGVWYAGVRDEGTQYYTTPGLYISSDGTNWTVYHQFQAQDGILGFFHYAGYAGGKLHFVIQTPYYRHFAISPATTRNTARTIVQPAVSGITDNSGYSMQTSFEGDANHDWAAEVSSVWAKQHVTDASNALHGTDYVLGYSDVSRKPYSYDSIKSKQFFMMAGQVYNCVVWMKGTRPARVMLNWYDGASYVGQKAEAWIDTTWREYVWFPYMSGTNISNCRCYVTIEQTMTPVDVLVDCAQVSTGTPAAWANEATQSDVLSDSYTTASAWTDLFAVQPWQESEFFTYLGPLFIKSWVYDADNYVELSWSSASKTFKIVRTVAGVVQPAVQSAACRFSRNATLKFALRSDSQGIALFILNGGTTAEKITDLNFAALNNAAIVNYYGDHTNANMMPMTVLSEINLRGTPRSLGMVSRSLTDSEISAMMDFTNSE